MDTFTPCSCRSCQSQGRRDPGPDCLYFSPYRYALSKRASEDTAAEFHEYVREVEHDTGVTPVTAKAWYSFQGVTA